MNLFEKKHAWILGGFEYLHADDVIANAGSGGATFRTDQLGTGQHVPFTKLMSGTLDDTAVIPGDATNGLYVQVKATVATPVTDNGGTLSIDDGAGSITIDATSLPLPTGAATETTLSALNTKVATAITADYDTGAGTQTMQMHGLALPASGGAVAGGTATNPIRNDPTGTTAQPVTDNGGTLSIDDGAGSITVDGTVTANAGSGTFAISAASLPLPALAATSTKQSDGSQKTQIVDGSGNVIGATSNALDVNIKSGAGSGGTALADKAGFTEGTTSHTPIGGVYNETISADPTEDQAAAVRITAKRAIHVNLRDSSGNELSAGAQYAEDSVHVSGDQVSVAGVVRKDTATQLAGTDGDYSVLVNDASGRLHVNVGAVPADPFGANADAASATGSISAKLRFIAGTGIPITGTVTVGSHAVTNAGTFAVQDSEKVADNAAFTDGTTKVLPAGFILDETAGTALTENDAGAARMDSKRAQVLVMEDATTRGQRAAISAAGALSVTDIPATSGGYNISRTLAAASTNATSVKASAGQLFGWFIFNNSASTKFVKFYNKATSPTVGTDTPVLTIPIPAGSGANVEYGKGIAFATGIAMALTGAVADADTTVLAANDLIVNLFYK